MNFQECLSEVEGSPNFTTLLQLLKLIRKQKLRKSELVVKHGTTLLEQYASSLGDDVWNIHEQVCMAALDCHQKDIALHSLQVLQDKFPESSRVERLSALKKEFDGQYTPADKDYATLITANSANSIAYKRQVCTLKAQGKLPAAISKMNDYLKIFQSDTEAWQELSNLYLTLGDFKKAQFCLEEMILAQPMNYMFHCRLAEILYTTGDFLLARKHFAQSIELHSTNNTRSLVGLSMCTYAIGSVKSKKADKELNMALYDHSKKGLSGIYANSPLKSYVDAVLEDQAEAIAN